MLIGGGLLLLAWLADERFRDYAGALMSIGGPVTALGTTFVMPELTTNLVHAAGELRWLSGCVFLAVLLPTTAFTYTRFRW